MVYVCGWFGRSWECRFREPTRQLEHGQTRRANLKLRPLSKMPLKKINEQLAQDGQR